MKKKTPIQLWSTMIWAWFQTNLEANQNPPLGKEMNVIIRMASESG